MVKVQYHFCASSSDFEDAKDIASQYISWLNMDLNFQNVEKEFAQFSKMYATPYGAYLLAQSNFETVGGVGVRFLENGICEMKRLFVKEEHQGMGVGKILCRKIIVRAKELGYFKMRLDTVSKLKAAIALYEGLGFREIEQYCENPDPTAKYFEIKP